ncbi:Uncharacterised protein at_DN1178 [Pycnogonum litorale]
MVDRGNRKRLIKDYLYNNIGLFSGLFCGTCNASIEFSSKWMTRNYSPAEVTFLKYLVHFPVNFGVILASGYTFKPAAGETKYLLAKCVSFTVSNLLLCTSFTILPYFDSFVVAYGIMVILSILLGRVWLKETINAYVSFVVLLLMSGVVMIAHPAFEMKSKEIVGYLCSIGSGICLGIAGCVNRKIKETPSTTIAFYISACGLPISSAVMIIQNDFKLPDDLKTVLISLCIGCCSVAMNIVWSKGLQLSSVSKIMLAVQCEIPLGFVLQFAFFHEIPHILSIIGSCCISLAVIFLILEDFLKSLCQLNK